MTYRDEIKVGDLVQHSPHPVPIYTRVAYEVRGLNPDGDGRVWAACLNRETGMFRRFPVEKLTKFRVMENER